MNQKKHKLYFHHIHVGTVYIYIYQTPDDLYNSETGRGIENYV